MAFLCALGLEEEAARPLPSPLDALLAHQKSVGVFTALQPKRLSKAVTPGLKSGAPLTERRAVGAGGGGGGGGDSSLL